MYPRGSRGLRYNEALILERSRLPGHLAKGPTVVQIPQRERIDSVTTFEDPISILVGAGG
jgi:hypothetical protein